jgi:hypothetical protein
LDLQTEVTQAGGDEASGFKLLESKLGMGVQMPPVGDYLHGDLAQQGIVRLHITSSNRSGQWLASLPRVRYRHTSVSSRTV